MMRILFLGCLLITSFQLLAQQDKANAYIDKFKDIAIYEMQRTGVPAAITLAQGILESGYGESDLCKNSNNHFGIKCKLEWLGEKVYSDDDTKQECFRKYNEAKDSYKDHSDFLKTRPNYTNLFTLDPTDYEGWAVGLKKAGYATEKDYANRLISLINTYDLNNYSLLALNKNYIPKISVASNSNDFSILKSKTITTTVVDDEKDIEEIKVNANTSNIKSEEKSTYPNTIFRINNSNVIFAEAGTSLLGLAQEYNISLNKLFSYNDIKPIEVLQKNQLIFLEKKQKKSAKEFHVVAEGETLYDIAQKEGIRLEYLAELNNINQDITPLVGETIYLKNKALLTPKFSVAQLKNSKSSTTN